jgi:hypothetical protein
VKYEVLYTLGKGNFGKVYMAESRKDGKQVPILNKHNDERFFFLDLKKQKNIVVCS